MPASAILFPMEYHLKRAACSLLGLFFLCLPLLRAQSGKTPLNLYDVIHPSGIVAPGISALSWRPGGKQLTYVRPTAGKPGNFTLCAYDLARYTETVLFDPGSGATGDHEKLDLDSYQWSPQGNA